MRHKIKLLSILVHWGRCLAFKETLGEPRQGCGHSAQSNLITPNAGPANKTWVVVGSANGSTNLGDECMWESTVKVLRASRGEVEVVTDAAMSWIPPVSGVRVMPHLAITLRRGQRWLSPAVVNRWPMIEKLVSRPWRNRYAHHISARSTFKPKGAVQVAWRDAIQASEGLIVSGAGAINDDFAPHGVASWDLMIAWAVQAKKPVAIIGQGIGPLEIRLNRVVARRMLNRADVISVRERRSLEVVKGLGVVCEPSVTPDWAIISEPTPCDREIAKTLMRELTAGEKFFAISLHRTATTRSPNLAKLASLSLSFLELAEADGYRTVFIPNMTAGRYSDDRETARDIETRWSRGDRSRLIVVDGGISPGVTRALLGLSDGLVSTRYHPLVFALSEGVPSLGISHDAYYDQKLLGASEMFGVAANVKRLGDPNLTAQWVLNVLRNQTVPKLEDTVKRQIERPLLSFLSRS